MPTHSSSSFLRIGFVPLVDCAPLIVASREGLFAKYGLEVHLSRELGWASIRDKIIYGELDAAHALGTLPLSIALGVGTASAECPASLVLNLHGCAITLASRLRDAGIQDSSDLRAYARSLARGQRLTLGVVFSPSSHMAVLRRGLKSNRIDPDHDVIIATVPPGQVLRNLRAGTIDGFCAGEPWNTLAIHEKIGWSPAASATIFPGHAEKVLMLSPALIQKRPEDAEKLTAAVLAACRLCDDPDYRPRLADLLAERRHLDQPAVAIRKSLTEPFVPADGTSIPRMIDFYGDGVNRPSPAHTAWFWQACRDCIDLEEKAEAQQSLLGNLYRVDLFDAARERRKL